MLKTRDLLIVLAAIVVLYLLTQQKTSSARTGGARAGASGGDVQVDAWSHLIDTSVGALDTLWNAGKSIFGGSSSSGYPTDVTTYNPNALDDPTMGSGPVSFGE